MDQITGKRRVLLSAHWAPTEADAPLALRSLLTAFMRRGLPGIFL